MHPAVLQHTGGGLSASQAQTQQAQPVAAARPGLSRQLWCGVPVSTVWHDPCTRALAQTSQPVWAAPDCRLCRLASRFVRKHMHQGLSGSTCCLMQMCLQASFCAVEARMLKIGAIDWHSNYLHFISENGRCHGMRHPLQRKLVNQSASVAKLLFQLVQEVVLSCQGTCCWTCS